MWYLFYLGTIIIGGGAIWFAASRIGRQNAVMEQQESNIEAAKRIAEGAADSPHTVSDLTQRLRNGGKL